MTDLKVLDELQRLSKAATPGPWHGDRYDGTVKYEMCGAGEAVVLKVQHKSGEYGFVGDRGDEDEALVMALRNSADSLIADSRRLQKIEAAAQDVVRVIEVWAERGLTDVSIDGIADALRRGLEDCAAGAVEPTSPSVEGRA